MLALHSPPAYAAAAAAGEAPRRGSEEDALQAAGLAAGAACEMVEAMLGLLRLPFLHDEGIARRLAACSAVALDFGIPLAALEHGLVGGQVGAGWREQAAGSACSMYATQSDAGCSHAAHVIG